MIEKFALFLKNILDWLKSDLCIFKYFSDALKITNNNIILATPLILFIIFSSSYLIFTPVNKVFNIAFVLFLFFAMTAAFFSGWFYTIKLAIDSVDANEFVKPVAKNEEEKEVVEHNENIKNDSFYLLKQFPTGVGTHFIEYFFMIVIFFLLLTLVIIFSYKTAYMLIGSIGISRPELFFALSSPEAMKNLISSLTIDQQMKLSYWNLYFLFTTTLYSFLIMFWAPEIVYKKESVVNALINSLAKLFQKFFKSLTIFSFLMLIYFLISLFSALIKVQIIEFLFTVLYFYFLVYAAILVFLFYKKEFCLEAEEDK